MQDIFYLDWEIGSMRNGNIAVNIVRLKSIQNHLESGYSDVQEKLNGTIGEHEKVRLSEKLKEMRKVYRNCLILIREHTTQELYFNGQSVFIPKDIRLLFDGTVHYTTDGINGTYNDG